MTANITSIGQPPPIAGDALADIALFGLKANYVPQFDVSLISLDRRVQARTENVAPGPVSRQYGAHMKAGKEFPPIIITADNFIVDGNTRKKGLDHAKIPFFGALVLTVPYEGPAATPEVVAKIRALAAARNQSNGVRFTAKENRVAVKDYFTLGWNTQQIAKKLGLSNAAIMKIRQEVNASERMASLGVVPPNVEHMANCGLPQALLLNDGPYKRLVLLIADAHLTSRETKAIAEEAKKAGNDPDAENLLSGYRKGMEDRITQNAMTGQGKPSKSGRFRQALGTIIRYEGSECDAIETAHVSMADHLYKAERTLAILQKVVAGQKAANAKAGIKPMTSDDAGF